MLLEKPGAFELLGPPRLNDYTDAERIKLIDIVRILCDDGMYPYRSPDQRQKRAFEQL